MTNWPIEILEVTPIILDAPEPGVSINYYITKGADDPKHVNVMVMIRINQSYQRESGRPEYYIFDGQYWYPVFRRFDRYFKTTGHKSSRQEKLTMALQQYLSKQFPAAS